MNNKYQPEGVQGIGNLFNYKGNTVIDCTDCKYSIIDDNKYPGSFLGCGKGYLSEFIKTSRYDGVFTNLDCKDFIDDEDYSVVNNNMENLEQKILEAFENKIKKLFEGKRLPLDKLSPKTDATYKDSGIDLAYSWYREGYIARYNIR